MAPSGTNNTPGCQTTPWKVKQLSYGYVNKQPQLLQLNFLVRVMPGFRTNIHQMT